MSYAIQSNSFRGDKMHDIVDRTVIEILNDVCGMLGPGATDAFIVKDDQTYYTRDGKEVTESLIFDNELSNKVHQILYQAAYHQGKDIGDGSTTLTVLYCHLYLLTRSMFRCGELTGTINTIRARWKRIITTVIEKLQAKASPLTEENMLSMFYTCTQDAELAAKLFRELKDPVLAGAYIVPRPSNIASDFRITTYNRPVLKVTKQFSLKPVADTVNHAVIFYCNGMLDIAHEDVLAAMAATVAQVGGLRLNAEYIILCHGMTEATRRSTRELVRLANLNHWDMNRFNNVAIYTLDEYRKMSQEELEDIATILTDEPGMGTLVNAITFEHLLYRAFDVGPGFLEGNVIPELETFDIDPHSVEKMKVMRADFYEVMFDDIEGMAIGKELGKIAAARYNELRTAIAEEKSSIKKQALNRRLRRSFGMFIDIEVGSGLLKDSQRKFELILDAILSGATAAQEKTLTGNSIIHALRTVCTEFDGATGIDKVLVRILELGLSCTISNLISNYTGGKITTGQILYDYTDRAKNTTEYDVEDFTFSNGPNFIWPPHAEVTPPEGISVTMEDDEGKNMILTVNPKIIEPFGSIKAILTNSILAIELAMTEVFHISARTGFMQNFIESDE